MVTFCITQLEIQWHVKGNLKKRKTNLFGLPHLQDRHASNYGVWILLCCRIHCVVGSDDQCQVCLCGPQTFTHLYTRQTNLWLNAPQLSSSLMLLGSPAPHLSPSVINRTMCLRLQAWLLRKQDCCPDNMACLNIKTTRGCAKCGWKGEKIITHNWSCIIIWHLPAKVTTHGSP